jgi:hypothetical protein
MLYNPPDPWQDRALQWLVSMALVFAAAVLLAAAQEAHQFALFSVATVAYAYWAVVAVGQVVGR